MAPSSDEHSKQVSARRLACAECGAEFSCSPTGPCWCFDESFRMPMPTDGGDCLCPACLRKRAEQHATVSAK